MAQKTRFNTEAYLLLSRRTSDSSAWCAWFSVDQGSFSAKLRGSGKALALPQAFSKVQLTLQRDHRDKLQITKWNTDKAWPLKGKSCLIGFYLLELIRMLAPERVAMPEVFAALDFAFESLAAEDDADIARGVELALLLAADGLPNPYQDERANPIEVHNHYQIRDGQWRVAEQGLSGEQIQLLQHSVDDPRSLRKLCRFCVDQALGHRQLKTRRVLEQW